MNQWESFWLEEIKKIDQKGIYRNLQLLEDKKDFSSNDYLSLSRIGILRNALINKLKKQIPLSVASSRLIKGHTIWHQQIEQSFQKFTGQESALFFPSGYMANIGLISTLGSQKNTALFSDQLNHASLIEGCRLSKAPCFIYPHKNLSKLEDLLKKSQVKSKIIITESLFSMDGDRAPLEELLYLAIRWRALLIVDEAHAVGIFGPKGGGFCSRWANKEPLIGIYPCGKALIAGGCFVCGPLLLKKYLINKCKSFIYTTASSPIQAFLIDQVLKFLNKNPQRRIVLKSKARLFRSFLKENLDTGYKDSPIVPILTGDAQTAILWSKFLQKKGYDIRGIRYPSVPKGKERLRISIHYNHSKRDLKILSEWIQILINKRKQKSLKK